MTHVTYLGAYILYAVILSLLLFSLEIAVLELESKHYREEENWVSRYIPVSVSIYLGSLSSLSFHYCLRINFSSVFFFPQYVVSWYLLIVANISTRLDR